MNKTNLIVGIGIILCAGSLIWLEGRFETSDLRKSKKLVRTFMVDGRGETFEQFIVRKHGGAAGTWDSDVTDSCRGVARVQWALDGNPPTIYQWDVDLTSQEIFAVAESPGGRQLLEEFKAEPEELPPLDLPDPAPAAGSAQP